MKHFGYGDQDYIPSEYSGSPAVDIHHLNGRGPGKDVIDNLMALTRDEHLRADKDKEFNEYLKVIHAKRLRT